MDRAVDTAASEQARVRRVDDRVDVLLGDVAADDLDHSGNAQERILPAGNSSCAPNWAGPGVYAVARPPRVRQGELGSRMHDAAVVFRAINLIAYPALGLVTLLYWRRRRDAASMWAAATFGTLGLLVLLGLIPDHAGNLAERAVVRIDIALLVLFPYLLFRFTTAFRRPEQKVANGSSRLTAILLVWTFALPRIPQPGEPRPLTFTLVHRRLHHPLDGALDRVRVAALERRTCAADGRPAPHAAPRDRDRGPDRSPSCSRFRAGSGLGLSLASQRPRHAQRHRIPARLCAAAGPAPLARAGDGTAAAGDRKPARVCGIPGRGGLACARAGRRDRRSPRDCDPQRGGQGRRRLERSRGSAGRVSPPARKRRRCGPTPSSSKSTFRAGASSSGHRRTRRSSARRSSRCSATLGAVGLALDRVRLFQAEHETRLALERANEVKTNFIALAAHELRTPMTTIHGFVTTLHHLADRLDDEQRSGARSTPPADAAHGGSRRAAARSLAARRGGDRDRSGADERALAGGGDRRTSLADPDAVDVRSAATRLRSSTATHSSAS